MQTLAIFITVTLFVTKCGTQTLHESDINFRVEAGSKTCFFEKGKAGQTMEAFYQVVDGQHGDLDINFEIRDPNSKVLVSDHKKPQNSIIMDISVDGDYVFCMDNTFSLMNSKLVFVNVVIEDKKKDVDEITTVNPLLEHKKKDEPVLEWTGVDSHGKEYFVEVTKIIESLRRTLNHVVKARQLLDIYGAMKSRDHYAAFEDTFIVDVWSGFQISFMFMVGMLQVYMIKNLFNKGVN